MRVSVLIAVLLLAACATPRQSCERNALYDLRAVDALIVETEQTLARGYALRPEPYRRSSVRFCYSTRVGDRNRVGFIMCDQPELGVRERPVAVDLRAERAKLVELKKKRKDLARVAARNLAECRARYPEG